MRLILCCNNCGSTNGWTENRKLNKTTTRWTCGVCGRVIHATMHVIKNGRDDVKVKTLTVAYTEGEGFNIA